MKQNSYYTQPDFHKLPSTSGCRGFIVAGLLLFEGSRCQWTWCGIDRCSFIEMCGHPEVYSFLTCSCLVMLLICTANAGLELGCNIRILPWIESSSFKWWERSFAITEKSPLWLTTVFVFHQKGFEVSILWKTLLFWYDMNWNYELFKMSIWVVFVGDLVTLSSWLLTILRFWAALLGSNVLWKLNGMWLLPQGWNLRNTWKKVSCFSTHPCAWIHCSTASGNWAAISRSHLSLKTISQDPQGTMTDMRACPKTLLGILKPVLSFTVTVWHTINDLCWNNTPWKFYLLQVFQSPWIASGTWSYVFLVCPWAVESLAKHTQLFSWPHLSVVS